MLPAGAIKNFLLGAGVVGCIATAMTFPIDDVNSKPLIVINESATAGAIPTELVE